ncbi:hypothetical protein BG004_003180 [Podila humilis]|nr:hypothetical protein BG004_003180 [Podila humilis]
MAPAHFKVVIVGGGIAGMTLGVILERAGIDFVILEASQEIRPLGATVYLGPPVMRAMEQLGLLDDIVRNSNVMGGVTIMDHRLTTICRVNMDHAEERYGHATLTIVRPKLYDILLSRIPAYKILFGKRVINSVEGPEGITVRCEDGTSHHGDILVGADGGTSPVRERIYQDIRKSYATASPSKSGKKALHRSDHAPPKAEQQCIVGITEPLASSSYAVLASKRCEMAMVMPKDTKCMLWFVPMSGNRFGWGVSTNLQPRPSESGPHTGKNTSRSHDEQATERSSLESRFSGPITTPKTRHYRSRSVDTDCYSTSSPPSSPLESFGQAFSNPAPSTVFKRTSRRDILSTYSTLDYESSASVDVQHQPQQTQQSTLNRLSTRLSSESMQRPLSSIYSSTGAGSKSAPTLKHKLSTATGVGRVTGTRDFTFTSSEPPVMIHSTHVPNQDNMDKTWKRLDHDFTLEGSIRDQATPFGGTLGDMVNATMRSMMSMVVVEERSRTNFMGTFTLFYQILTSSGHGTTQAILDAISLATLLTELPSKTTEDIETLFQVHFDRRAPLAKAAVTLSRQQEQLFQDRNMCGKFMRKVASNWMADWIKIRMGDRIFDRRPILPFLKSVPSRGSCRNKETHVSFLREKKFLDSEAGRRRRRLSLSSEYSIAAATATTTAAAVAATSSCSYNFNKNDESMPDAPALPLLLLLPLPRAPGQNQTNPLLSMSSNASSSNSTSSSSTALDDTSRSMGRRLFRRISNTTNGHNSSSSSSATTRRLSASNTHSRSSSFSSSSNNYNSNNYNNNYNNNHMSIPQAQKVSRPMSTILDAENEFPVILPQHPTTTAAAVTTASSSSTTAPTTTTTTTTTTTATTTTTSLSLLLPAERQKTATDTGDQELDMSTPSSASVSALASASTSASALTSVPVSPRRRKFWSLIPDRPKSISQLVA